MTRVATTLLLLVVLVFGALFVIEKYSDAQEPATCPAGTELAADGTTCLSPAVNDNVTTTTSCVQGVLSDDGQFCIVPRTDASPGPAATPLEAPVPTFTG